MLEIPVPKKFPFIPRQGIFLTLSLIITAVSVIIMVKNGLNYGIDFVGGIKLTYKFTQHMGDGEANRPSRGQPLCREGQGRRK
jgi:preprotein translocase subunit SecF